MADIERRYGPDPSTADRDIQLPAWDSPAMPAATGPGHIPRRSLASRKADEQAAVGFRPDGQPASRGRALVDMSTLLELLPERYWPLLPLAAIAGVVIVVVLVMILVLSLR